MGTALAGSVVGIMIGTAVLGIGGYPMFMHLFNQEVQNCYIKYNTISNRHQLMRTIAWNSDRNMGEYKSAQEAITEAKLLNCPLNPVAEAP